MAQAKSFISNITNGTNQTNVYLARPRLNKLMEEAINYPMTAVYAGSGYGKTRAIYSFLQEHTANTVWIQLTERDNVPSRFWENYAHMISLNWPDIGARLKEIGFPETEEAFKKYAAHRGETLSPTKMFFLVYDDFHLLHNPVVLNFFERAAQTLPDNARIILISRTMPEINIVGMMMHERIFTIREDDLCFTVDEISEYFKQLKLYVSRQDIRDIYEDTRGWAFGINLIGRSLSKETKYERYTLMAMKENIFSLIKGETSKLIGMPLWNFLLRISLIDHLASNLIKMLANDDMLIKDLSILNAYIRYDYHLGAYMIHNLFLDYLRQHQYQLSDEEKRETYNIAGSWCENNNYVTDALSYYEKAGNYDAIINIVYDLNLLTSTDMTAYAKDIFDRIPVKIARENPLFPAMSLKIKICLGMLDEASASAAQYVREYESRPESPINNHALASIHCAWAVLRMIMSPYTHEYDFDTHYKKMREYYDKNPYEAYGSATKQPVGSYALLIGTSSAEAPERYIAALKRAIPHSSHTLKGNLYGLDDLAQGELYFFQRNLNSAEQYLNMALDKAREKDQYDIQNRALQYLMLIYISSGDMPAAKNMLGQSEALLDQKDYTTRYEAHDILQSHFYIALGQPEKVPDWLKSDFAKYAHPAFMECYANRVRANYSYMTRQYNTLLAFLKSVRETHVLLYGKISFLVLEALTLYQLKRKEEAVSVLTEAYTLAEPNKIIVPFAQYAKDMRTLTSAAMKTPGCTIPKPWLEDINRKSSALARRLTHLISAAAESEKNSERTTLSNRETKVLKDLSQGLSRTETAASQNISVNTVKMVINSIYDKLRVTSLHDALRIAIARRLI